MTIHSHRERDRLAREQQKQLEDNYKHHKESLDALDAIWQASRDNNQDVIDRTTRGMSIDCDDYSDMPLPIIDEDAISIATNDDEDYEFFAVDD